MRRLPSAPGVRPLCDFSRLVVSALLVGGLVATSVPARADAATVLADIAAVHRACRAATGPGPRTLHAVDVAAGQWRFGGLQLNEVVSSDASEVTVAEGGTLFVDTQHNLRIVGGRAELVPAGLEAIGFTVSRERARLLEQARAAGASLRVGFFLGMDGRDGTLCVVRSAAAVSLVRAEVAFLEVVSADGHVVAREDTERLRALRDDGEDAPGEGPFATIGTPYGTNVPASWEAALVAAPRGATGRALAACHAAGLARGAASDGSIVVRLEVSSRTGSVRHAELELAANDDEEEAACLVRVLRGVSLPALAEVREDRVAVLSVPVRLGGALREASAPRTGRAAARASTAAAASRATTATADAPATAATGALTRAVPAAVPAAPDAAPAP
jgi:hypothetical protein